MSRIPLHRAATSPEPARRRARAPFQTAAALAAIAVLGTAGLRAQDPTPDAPQGVTLRETEKGIAFAINEADGLDISQFIKLAEQMTGKVFTFNQVELNSNPTKITFVGTIEMKKDDFFSFFQTMLYIKGFAVVPRGDGDTLLQEIIAMNGPRRAEINTGSVFVPTDQIQEYKAQTGVPILTTVPLNNINATVATNALRPFFAAGGAGQASVTLGNVGSGTAILMQGYGPQVYAAHQLLTLVDVPQEGPELMIRVVRLENAAAEEIEPHLNDILNDRNRRQGPTPGGQAGAPGSLDQVGQLKIATHLSLNAVILSGTTEQIREAQDLIARLDVPSDPTEGVAHVVRLKNVLADDLRQTLHQFMQEDVQAEQQAQAGGAGGAQRRPRRTVIQAHQESNSLLVSATASKYKSVLKLIDELDRKQPQVLIEAALVELTSSDLRRFGVELGLLDIADDNFTRPFAFTNAGLSTFTDTDDNGLPDTRLPDFENPLSGLTGGIISSDDFAIPMLVNAVATDDTANILSLPSVLVNNNETAFVGTTESRPTIENQQGTATTQSGLGEAREAGISLEISPTISPNNYLRLNIHLMVSRFLGAFDPNSPTGGGIIVSREVRTQVTMPSDNTMVIGGVIEDQEARTETGIPVLKDIPLLGYLFRSSTDETRKTNLYFFITPTILDDDDFRDLWHLSQKRKMEAMHYIGSRRLQLVDRKWSGGSATPPQTLEDSAATIDNIDHYGSNETPYYFRPDRSVGAQNIEPNGPAQPGAPQNQR